MKQNIRVRFGFEPVAKRWEMLETMLFFAWEDGEDWGHDLDRDYTDFAELTIEVDNDKIQSSLTRDPICGEVCATPTSRNEDMKAKEKP